MVTWRTSISQSHLGLTLPLKSIQRPSAIYALMSSHLKTTTISSDLWEDLLHISLLSAHCAQALIWFSLVKKSKNWTSPYHRLPHRSLTLLWSAQSLERTMVSFSYPRASLSLSQRWLFWSQKSTSSLAVNSQEISVNMFQAIWPLPQLIFSASCLRESLSSCYSTVILMETFRYQRSTLRSCSFSS